MSNERSYRLSILLAYWDDSKRALPRIPQWTIVNGSDIDEGPQEVAVRRILRPSFGNDYLPLTLGRENPCGLPFCSAILLCRWYTAERIQKQLPDLKKLIVCRRWLGLSDRLKMDAEEYRALDDYLNNNNAAGRASRESNSKILNFRAKMDTSGWTQPCPPSAWRLTINKSKEISVAFGLRYMTLPPRRYPRGRFRRPIHLSSLERLRVSFFPSQAGM